MAEEREHDKKPRQLKIKGIDGEQEEEREEKKEKGEKESKWVVVIILLLTVIASWLFSLKGGGLKIDRAQSPEVSDKEEQREVKPKGGILGPAVYEFE